MGDMPLLVYVFTTFVVGITCASAVLVLAMTRADDLTRAFLLFYAALTILVTGRLLLAFAASAPGEAAAVPFAIEYAESFVGRYGVMFALPYLAHRAFDVQSRARDRALLAVVALAALGQHATEFGFGGRFDAAGDIAEDVLFAVAVTYTLAVGFRRLNRRRVYRPFAARLLAVLGIGLPLIAFDLFLSDGTTWRFYPLLYCLASVTLTFTLVARHLSARRGIPPDWGLSRREAEVALLVGRGLGNRDIAEALTISPNTVKTHLRAIFDKSGFRTRSGLIATLAATEPAGRSADATMPI